MSALSTIAARLLFATVLLVPAISPAQEVASDLQAAVHLRILSYEHSLRAMRDQPVVVAVLHDASSEPSRGRAAAMTASFTALATKQRLTVHGRPVEVVLMPVPLAGGADLRQRLQQSGADVLYLSAGLMANVSTISRLAYELKLPTLCGDRELVRRGVAIGVVPRAGNPHIVISARAVQQSGMLLDPKVLRLAEVVR